ncbi:MAG: hypothetical protein NTZ14_18755, partial [Hyphomicrobiales bacterium]|nr:hypothetical protein [Hyphomicrobiales bacterium]
PEDEPILHLASTTYRIATGPHAGRRIATIGGGFHAAGSGNGKRLCAEIGGFSLNAATRCRAGDRFRLARLCRYLVLPACPHTPFSEQLSTSSRWPVLPDLLEDPAEFGVGGGAHSAICVQEPQPFRFPFQTVIEAPVHFDLRVLRILT